jgi:hypothetical protein
MIQKTKLKKKFNEAGLQITKEAIELLDRIIDKQVHNWIRKTKESNVKRLTGTLIWIVVGSYSKESDN